MCIRDSLYGAHLASGRAVLPDHDVVVFDETHELEEVMTSSLGVELTPGRFRAVAVSARSLVSEKEADTLASLLSLGDQIGALLADRLGTRVLHDGARPPVDDSPLADLLGRAAEVAGRVTDAIRRADLQGSLLADVGSASSDPDRGAHKTRAIAAAAHLSDDLHRILGRRDGEVAWVDGTRRLSLIHISAVRPGHRGDPAPRARGHGSTAGLSLIHI